MPWKLTTDSRITAQAVERQMSNWEIARRQRPTREKADAAGVADFIALSRELGVDAEQVALALGQRLGWPVFGKNLLEAMAGDDSVRRHIYDSMDERDLRWWEEMLHGVFDRDFGVNDYFHNLTRTVLSLVRQSPCVLVGRGCDLMLPTDIGLRVRLVAPLAERVDRIARELEIEPTGAAEELANLEARRADYLRHHFGDRATDPARADLTINLSRWNHQTAVELILAAHDRRSARVVTA